MKPLDFSIRSVQLEVRLPRSGGSYDGHHAATGVSKVY